MKKLKLLTNCTVILLFMTLNSKAQLKPSFNIRNLNITKLYHLSQHDVDAYNEVLNKIEEQRNVINNTKYSIENRKLVEKKLDEKFRAKVKTIFSTTQYDKWNKNHRGSLRVRFYKEDLGITSKQYAEYRKISKNYHNKKVNITKLNLASEEELIQKKEAFKQYSTSLHKLFSVQLAEYLIYENEVLNTAMTLSNSYTIISKNKAIKIAIIKMQYDNNKIGLEKQRLNTNQLREERKKTNDKYDENIRNVLTNDEYVICEKYRDKLTDKKHLYTYQISPNQLTQYKMLRKKLAMEQLIIKRSRIDKATKESKLKAAESTFEEQLQKQFTSQQFKRWKNDNSMKH